MKIVINSCFGGFSLSALAVQKLAQRKGRDCYFFEPLLSSEGYKFLTLEEAEKCSMFLAYSVPNPQDYRLNERDENGLFKSANERAKKISLDNRPDDRSDPDLIAVVEELGNKANGKCANLKIVEIPDGVDYEIAEYDGNEHIAEKHRIWD
jgi:hypothetical protein